MTIPEKIKHLYWRASFGLSPNEWKSLQHRSLATAIDDLFAQAKSSKQLPEPEVFKNLSDQQIKGLGPIAKKKLRKKHQENVGQQNASWIGRMANPNASALLERVSLFWHGHFACELKNPLLAARQMNTLRQHGLSNFRNLLHAIAKDVAMIRYLNNQQNRKQKPNENFAREVMELFSIGRGNYTENDVKEAARAFTGWSSDLRGDFAFRARQHDYDSKQFMGHTGTFDGDQIIDIILEQETTAEFICRKIYRYFVNEKVDENIIRDLSRDFYQSDYDLEKLFRKIFSSDWFYAPQNVGTKIKSPIDLIAGMMRSLNVQFSNPQSLVFAQRALGQILFRPPNVAGWPGGKNWIDNSTLMLRLNLATYLYHAAEVSFNEKDLKASTGGRKMRRLEATTDFQPLIRLFTGQAEASIFSDLQHYLLQAKSNLDRTSMTPYVISGTSEDYIKSVALRLMTLPEYQMC